MNKTLTLDEFLLYYYGEACEMSDDDVIESLLINDESLIEDLQSLNDTRQIIENSMVNPPDEIVSKIIAYSEALTILNLSEPDLRTMIGN